MIRRSIFIKSGSAAALAVLTLCRAAHAEEPGMPTPLALPRASVPMRDRRIPQIYLDALFTYSIGAQSALGGEALATAGWQIWNTARGSGTIDLGLLVGYQAEPWSLAPFVNQDEAAGSNHHVRVLPNIGHTFRFGALRQVSFGVHVYAGMVYWMSTGTVKYATENVMGSATVSRVVPDAGVLLRFTWRPHPVVGLGLYIGAPFYGVSSSYAVDLFTVGAGLTFRLR